MPGEGTSAQETFGCCCGAVRLPSAVFLARGHSAGLQMHGHVWQRHVCLSVFPSGRPPAGPFCPALSLPQVSRLWGPVPETPLALRVPVPAAEEQGSFCWMEPDGDLCNSGFVVVSQVLLLFAHLAGCSHKY